MNILSKVTWKAMWQNRTRTLVTVAGVILSAAMFTAVAVMGISAWDFMVRGYTYEDGDYYLSIDQVTDEKLEALEREEAVSQVIDLQVLGYTDISEQPDSPEICCVAAGDSAFFSQMPVRLIMGRLPENSEELLVPSRYWYHYRGEDAPPLELGDTVELSLWNGSDLYPQLFNGQDTSQAHWTRRYRIVGVIENNFFDEPMMATHFLTLADSAQAQPVWHRAFVKTNPAKAVYELEQKDYGVFYVYNNALLIAYGAGPYGNFNSFLLLVCGILFGIIMLASVSLIHNAFSISVSERTKQFGLLASVGATRRQLRRSVLFEALAVCAMGIPLGLLSGYCGIAVVVHFLGGALENLFSFSADGAVAFIAVPSAIAFVTAAAVCTGTVLLSAWIPARRASRITPLEAIRQTSDYRVDAKAVRTGKLSYRLWGLPGLLAKKYYKTSRKKYRATVASLTISIVLFVIASAFCDMLSGSISAVVNTENFDFIVYDEPETCEDIRQDPAVEDSVWMCKQNYRAILPADAFSSEYKAYKEEFEGGSFPQDGYGTYSVDVYYMEDEALERFLRQQGIEPQIYLDPEHPVALICPQDHTGYRTVEGETERLSSHINPLSDQFSTLPFLTADQQFPAELIPEGRSYSALLYTREDGNVHLSLYFYPDEAHVEATVDYQIKVTEEADGGRLYQFCRFSLETGEAEETAACQIRTDRSSVFSLGQTAEGLPLGVRSTGSDIQLVLPFSAYLDSDDTMSPYLVLKSNDYYALKAVLDEHECGYSDYREEEINQRGLLLLVQTLAYGFIALIALISTANVFNTISTNIALRRRDFGMLSSVGLSERGLRRMMYYECLLYGSRAILFGVPISLLLSALILQVSGLISMEEYVLPWAAVLTASASVFVVVFFSMLYAISKLRRDAPIENIRMDNI